MSLDMNPSDTLLEEMARELGIDEDLLKTQRFFKLIKATVPVYIMNLTRKTAPFGGDIKENRFDVTLVNNTLKAQEIQVPAGKRWYLWGGKIDNGDDVNRNVYVQLRNETDDVIFFLLHDQVLATAEETYFPNNEATVRQLGNSYPIPLAAGWKLYFYWAAGGVSAGGTSKISALLVETDE